MEFKIGNSIVKSDNHNWIVERWANTDVIDFKTRVHTGKVEYKKKSEVFPATLKQAMYCVLNNEVKSSGANDAKSIMKAIKDVEKAIYSLVDERNKNARRLNASDLPKEHPYYKSKQELNK